MASELIPSPQPCVWYGPNGWLLRVERLVSATCMGWCLHASFQKYPKPTTIACVGGASSIILADFFLLRPASLPRRAMLLRAGEILSVSGITWCLRISLDEHPKAAMRACVAGALCIYLAKSAILSDPSASENETPSQTKSITELVLQQSEIYADFPVKLQNQIQHIGKELKEFCKDWM